GFAGHSGPRARLPHGDHRAHGEPDATPVAARDGDGLPGTRRLPAETQPSVVILGVVADDLTGATDAGSMSAKAGHVTHVYTASAFDGPDGAAVCVLDTDSRFDEPDVAYEKVRAATERLAAHGPRLLHKKTCSVFRGNVGAEFDAMLDAVDEAFAV